MPSTSNPLFSRLVANRPRAAFVIELGDASPALPEECSNCGEISSATRRERHGARSLLIPYCGRCAEDAARLDTTQFAALLASVVLVVTLLLTLPRLFFDLGLGAYLLSVLLGALAPLVLLAALRPVTKDGQCCSGRAAFLDTKGRLTCFSERWARTLAERVQTNLRGEHRREPRVAKWMFAVAVTGAAITPSLHTFNFPSLVVLNLGDGPAELLIDGHLAGTVEATSLESQRAGTRLRIAAGKHLVEARDGEGRVIQRTEMQLQGGALHLLRISGQGYCFWLEEDGYGEQSRERSYRSLASDRSFWVIPARIDSWFSENPSPSLDDRSSGGTMTALRHAPCQEAPAPVGGRPR